VGVLVVVFLQIVWVYAPEEAWGGPMPTEGHLVSIGFILEASHKKRLCDGLGQSLSQRRKKYGFAMVGTFYK